MRRVLALTLILVVLTAAGCAGLTPQQQRMLSGGAIGAAGGAALGAIGGSAVLGAAVGGGAGVAAGAFWEDITKAFQGGQQRQ